MSKNSKTPFKFMTLKSNDEDSGNYDKINEESKKSNPSPEEEEESSVLSKIPDNTISINSTEINDQDIASEDHSRSILIGNKPKYIKEKKKYPPIIDFSNGSLPKITEFNSLQKNNLLGKKTERKNQKEENPEYLGKIENNGKFLFNNIQEGITNKKTSEFTLKIEEPKKKKKFQFDNIYSSINTGLKALVFYLVQLIEILGNIKLQKPNLRLVIGGIKQNQKVYKTYLIYQILCTDKKDKNKTILENAEPKNERNKKLFYYFLTRTFGFIFQNYYENNKEFNIDGQIEYVHDFITLKKIIQKRIETIYKKYTEERRNKKIEEFRNISEVIYNNYEGYDIRNEKTKKKTVIKFDIPFLKKFDEYLEKEKKQEMPLTNMGSREEPNEISCDLYNTNFFKKEENDSIGERMKNWFPQNFPFEIPKFPVDDEERPNLLGNISFNIEDNFMNNDRIDFFD